MDFIHSHAQDLVTLGLAVLGVFSIVAKLTPTNADNVVVDKLLALVHTLGLTK